MYIRHSDFQDIRYIRKSLEYVFGFQTCDKKDNKSRKNLNTNNSQIKQSLRLKSKTIQKHFSPTNSPLKLQISPILIPQQSKRQRLLTVPELKLPDLSKNISQFDLQPSPNKQKQEIVLNYNKLQLRLQNLTNRIQKFRNTPQLNPSSKNYYGIIGQSKRALRQLKHSK